LKVSPTNQAMVTQRPLRGGSDLGELDESLPIYSLNDDTVKLVAYAIVSIKRDRERVMPEGEGTIIVTDPMSGRAFTSWIIASYAQARRAKAEKEADPGRSKQLQKDLERDLRVEGKYLRVYYVVSHRWTREPLEFEERQVTVLEQIRDACSG
jgi:hypothetical protein